jgi:hypothetical protein
MGPMCSPSVHVRASTVVWTGESCINLCLDSHLSEVSEKTQQTRCLQRVNRPCRKSHHLMYMQWCRARFVPWVQKRWPLISHFFRKPPNGQISLEKTLQNNSVCKSPVLPHTQYKYQEVATSVWAAVGVEHYLKIMSFCAKNLPCWNFRPYWI